MYEYTYTKTYIFIQIYYTDIWYNYINVISSRVIGIHWFDTSVHHWYILPDVNMSWCEFWMGASAIQMVWTPLVNTDGTPRHHSSMPKKASSQDTLVTLVAASNSNLYPRMPPAKPRFSIGFVHCGISHEALAAVLGDDDKNEIVLHHNNHPPTILNTRPLQVDLNMFGVPHPSTIKSKHLIWACLEFGTWISYAKYFGLANWCAWIKGDVSPSRDANRLLRSVEDCGRPQLGTGFNLHVTLW